ncbi:DNA cytosine methyltransferase [Ulvibacterium marinum]|uniref:Cytosine-specific methyltransferase n=1 Tax=Ulvibacterium marinum TaxID=2419782 RepID=A0A3B0C9H3_9FLAO|nr:DNA (cytosine-5-)-methyltransferase [Ulvibacterium marinum]RKN81208.1 DNA (cytosine-5-)-methyltransferase [Ulvibacterium marinum]
MNYIDLFSGAGGLSEGFLTAGFKPIVHVEFDRAACFTLKTRAVFHHLRRINKLDFYYSYLKGDIDRNELYKEVPAEIIDSVINAEIGRDNKRVFQRIEDLLSGDSVDLIIGGPPCQAYSVVGRAPLKHKKDDERTNLYIQYGRYLKKFNPKVFVFENVPGLLTAAGGKYFNNLQKYYKRIGYKVKAKSLNAYDFGVVQNRKRVIIIGWKKDLEFNYPDFEKIENKFYRDDIFNDLPSIKPGEVKRIQNYASETNAYLSSKAIRNGIDFVTQHITRPHNERDLAIYNLAIELLENGKRLKNSQVPEEMRTQKNTKHFLDRFKVVGVEPHTVIAHIAKDGHHFIHPDKKQLRSISVREAARIQSFPDDFYFEGIKEDQPRTSAFRQIGNAVPPLLAKEIAVKIKDQLHG